MILNSECFFSFLFFFTSCSFADGGIGSAREIVSDWFICAKRPPLCMHRRGRISSIGAVPGGVARSPH